MTPPGEPHLGWFPVQYREDAPIYHGKRFRCLKGIFCQYDGAYGRIVAPPTEELAGDRSGRDWLLPIGALDACLMACGAFSFAMFKGRVELPQAFRQVRLGRLPAAGEACVVRAYYRGGDERNSNFDFALYGEDGAPLLLVDGYQSVRLQTGSQ